MHLSEITYEFDPAPDRPLLDEGAVTGWLVWRDPVYGDRAAPCVAVTDADGHGFAQTTGPWEPVTVRE